MTDAHRRDVVLDADLGARLRELAASASAALGRDVPVRDCSRAVPAKQLLRYLWDATTAEMLHAADSRALPDRIAGLTVLLTRIRAAEGEVDDSRVNDGVELLRRVRRALTRMRDATTVDDLLARAPEAVCTLGFDRALLSTVKDSVWNLHTMHIDSDPRWAEEILAIGQQNPPKLNGSIVESDIVEQARPGLVFDVQHNPRVDRPLVQICRSTSYGIAPLTIRGKVVGLVHADCYRPHREVDATDRAVLNLFAEGLSHTLARVTVLDRLADLRRGIDTLADDADLVTRQQIPAPTAAHPLLSSREVDVIELLACGEPNRLIARKLSISEGTVKTHITHILRKLGAANRAEAVAYWLRDTAGTVRTR